MKLVLLLAAGAFAAQDVTPPVISLTFDNWVGHEDGKNAAGAAHQWDASTPVGTVHALPSWYTQEMNARNADEKVSKRASVTCVVDTQNTDATATWCPDPSCTASDHHDDSVQCDEPRVMQISKSATSSVAHAQAYGTDDYADQNDHWRQAHVDNTVSTWGDDRIATARNRNAQDLSSCTPGAQTTCVKRNQLGQYLVTYTATDSSGNKAEPIAFTFIFIDPIVPQFTFSNADDSQAHGATGYSDDMYTWPQYFTVNRQDDGGAVWNEGDVTVVSTANTFGHIVSAFATSAIPSAQITKWGNSAPAGSDLSSWTAFDTGLTAAASNALANVEAGNCNKLYGGAQSSTNADVPAMCTRTSANGNWADYNLDVTVTDNYRAQSSIKVFSRISTQAHASGDSNPNPTWTQHTGTTTTTLCMAAGNKFTIDWYADDEAGIFGWKHKSNPQAHRVQITVTDNTRPTIHPLGADDTTLLRKDERSAVTNPSATNQNAYSVGTYGGTWSTHACKGFSDDCSAETTLSGCAGVSGCVWTKTLKLQTSACDAKTEQDCIDDTSCDWHTYSTLSWSNGLSYSNALTKCRSKSENQAGDDAADHETSDLLECGHDGSSLMEEYVERGFDVFDNQDGMTDGSCSGWARVKCEFASAAAASATDNTATKTGTGFADTNGVCYVDNTDLHEASPYANAGGAQQLTAADQAAFDADRTVTYMYKDSNGNIAAPVTRRVVVVDTVPPTLSLSGDCVIQNSAGAHYNSSAAQDTIAESTASNTNGLFDHDRIARFFSHRDDCDREVHTIVTLHTGGCDWDTTGGAVSGNTNCHGKATGAKLGCEASDDAANTNCFLGVFKWNGDENTISAQSDSDEMGASAGTYHQEFHEYIAGEYAVQYKTQDASGHSVTACRKIQNVDHTYPIIQILGSDQMTLEATHQGNYIDDGATCSDQVDGVISQNVEVSGDVVNLSKVGTYTITYNCKDSANNAAPAAQRTVVVAQTSCPKCTIHGGTNPDIVHEASFPYSDAGAACSDVIDGDVTTLCFTAAYDGGGVVASGTVQDQFAGGATWTGKGYCDQMVGSTNANCAGKDRTDCLDVNTCKWNQYSACDTSGAGSNNLITDTAVASTTNSGAQIGTYYITYRAKNTVGLYNDGANCRGGAIQYVRKVTVKDTLRPVITLKYDSGSGSATVAQGDLSPTDTETSDLSLSDTATDKQYPSVTGAYTSQGSFDDTYGGNHEAEHTLMAEESTSSVNGWVIGAIASAVAGLALLGYSTRRTAVATSVPV